MHRRFGQSEPPSSRWRLQWGSAALVVALACSGGMVAGVVAPAGAEEAPEVAAIAADATSSDPTPTVPAPPEESPGGDPSPEAPISGSPATEAPVDSDEAATEPKEPETGGPDAEETPAIEPAEKGLPSLMQAPIKKAPGVISPQAEGDATLAVLLKQETGTAPFDASDAPGYDSSGDNDIVRTNDTIKYTVSVRFEGDTSANPKISFTLPKGEQLVTLPSFCLTPVSSVSPETMPNPMLPVTGTSWESLPTQTVVCRVRDENAGTSLDYPFVAKVRSEVPNGTALTPMTATATSDQVTVPAISSPVSHRVSAAARFDVSKRGMETSPENNTGPLYSLWGSCSYDAAKACLLVDYPLTITAPRGGKGITPLASPITLVDDLSPDALYGPGTTASDAWQAELARPGGDPFAKYGARMTICDGRLLNVWSGIPYSEITGAQTPINSVRDSGTIECQQSKPGAPAAITIEGADTTALTIPTRTGEGGTLQADSAYVVSTSVRVEIPLEAVRELTTEVSGTWTMNTTNTFKDFEADDIAGHPNLGEKLENNTRKASAVLTTGPGNVTKAFIGATGTRGNTPAQAGGFSGWEYEGPPGSGSYRDGNTVVVPGQTVMSSMFYNSTLPPTTGTTYGRSVVMCDVWDSTKLALLETYDYVKRAYSRMQYASGGAPVWVAQWEKGGTQPDASALPGLKIQYSSTLTPGSGANSSCDSGAWSDTPSGVAGATVVDGVWQGVNRVRVFFTTEAPATGSAFNVHAVLAMKVLPTAGPTGTTLPNWASLKSVPGTLTLDATTSATTGTSLSSYGPVNHTGSLGDRLILGSVKARIKKLVRDREGGVFIDNSVPAYTAGSKVDYQLTPTLTADVSVGLTAPVTVEDCLPRYQTFLGSTRGDGTSITPSLIQSGAPAGSEIVCPANRTYIKWDLAVQEINKAISPIIVHVEVVETVRGGVYTNDTVVSTPGDPSPIASRQDSVQIQVSTPTGIKIAKTVDKSVIELNPEGVTVPRGMTWTVEMANIDSPLEVSDVDVIDVLPADGVFGSNFTGELSIDSVTPSAGVTVWYTKAAPATLAVDPDAGSNGSAGSTVWCDADSSGAVVSGAGTVTDCPAGLAEVTGLRFQRPGPFTPDDELKVRIATTPVANAGGDIYENRTAGRAQGVTQPVGPAIRRVAVIESSVGDYVWEDLNSDGVQDAGEPGIAGFPVKLVGTDLDGNAVSLSTTTDAEGKYKFTGLASGNYQVTFDPAGLGIRGTFTVANAGGDDTADSDGDTTTGVAAEFALAPDSDDPSWDQGVIIDHGMPDISVEKKVVSNTDTGTGKATLVYEVIATNSGTFGGSYDLIDLLKFGGGVTVDSATVVSDAPGTIAVNPDFDGVADTEIVSGISLPKGETHRYLVTVDATVSTTTTEEEADCILTATETGTGFLNEVTLTVNDVTTTGSACEEPVVPPGPTPTPSPGGDLDSNDDERNPDVGSEGALANAGGPALWGGLLGALMLGVGVIVVRRSRTKGEHWA